MEPKARLPTCPSNGPSPGAALLLGLSGWRPRVAEPWRDVAAGRQAAKDDLGLVGP